MFSFTLPMPPMILGSIGCIADGLLLATLVFSLHPESIAANNFYESSSTSF
jgi:hypothetical protein